MNFLSFANLGKTLLAALTLAVFFGATKAQDEPIRIETDLIGFEITVFDQNGLPARGLQAKDFTVWENGIRREADFFEPLEKSSGGSRPLAAVFALDVSGSVTSEETVKLREALRSFIKRLADYDSYFAVATFGMEVKVLQGLTNNPKKLEKSLDKIWRDEEGLSTHAYDAVDDAIRLLREKAPSLKKNKPVKKAVILITDGFPVGDIVSPETVIERANEAETIVYSIILPSYSRLGRSKKPLPTPLEISGLAEKTGGNSFYAEEKNFELLFKALAEEITASYNLAIYPSEEAKRSGKFSEIKIEAPQGFTVRQNRGGYLVKRQ